MKKENGQRAVYPRPPPVGFSVIRRGTVHQGKNAGAEHARQRACSKLPGIFSGERALARH